MEMSQTVPNIDPTIVTRLTEHGFKMEESGNKSYLDYYCYTSDIENLTFSKEKVGMKLGAHYAVEEDAWYGTVHIDDVNGTEYMDRYDDGPEFDKVFAWLRNYKDKFESCNLTPSSSNF
jgi:hypothetical protein